MTIKALIADDSCLDRRILSAVLQSAGIRDVAVAKDGDEAIQIFDQEVFDLVVTDWNMPRRTGLDVVRAIRARGYDLPIIMVTGESEEAKREVASQAGASDYCTKPLDAAAFLNVVAKHFDAVVAN
jgi:two-component system chemotaxis response regulator CheY